MADQDAAALWGGAEYERIAERFAPIHEALIERVAVAAGEHFLDVATGTGEVALRAARIGAHATGLDLAPALLEQARVKADRESLAVEWVEGNAETLPFDDGSFDVVCSSFGVIFAPDAEAAARELGRVCRGRLGLTTWQPNAGLHRIYATFRPGGADPTERWADESEVRELLSTNFDLEIEERVWTLEGDSPEDVWELMTAAAPPVKAFVEKLGPEELESFRDEMLEFWSGFEQDGRVLEPRGYLLISGERR